MSSQALSTHESARQIVPCLVCSSTRYEPFLDVKGYSLVRCTQCGLWFINPQPTAEELAEFYAAYEEPEPWKQQREEHFNGDICRLIMRYLNGTGSVLDVGSGRGNFLATMLRAGFKVQGVEPWQVGATYAREVYGLPIFNGMFEDYLTTTPGTCFDALTLLNVLEHLRNPGQMLAEVKQLIRPQGILAVVVPDARFHALFGGIRKTFGVADPYWLERPIRFLSGFKLPDHLSSFSPRIVASLLDKSGFKIETVKNAPVVFNAGLHRNVAKLAVAAFSHALQCASLGRILFGYSTLILARRL